MRALEGFTFVESDYLPFISLDKIGRFHVSKNARRLLNIKSYDSVVLAYHGGNNELAVISTKVAKNIDGATFSYYLLDKRNYMSAKALAKEFNLLGQHRIYYFDRSAANGEVFIFKSRD